VQPILDLLEVEIRLRYYHGMTNQEMKLLVQDWIDKEIAALKKIKVIGSENIDNWIGVEMLNNKLNAHGVSPPPVRLPKKCNNLNR